jgi:uncharacterized protein (TIGR02444 family)
MSDTRANPLRTFARSLYAERDAGAACRALSVREGLNVNVLLFCAWAGRHGHGLTAGQIERLRAVSTPWREAVTDKLTSVRTWLVTQEGFAGTRPDGDGSDGLADTLATAEQDADRIEQDMLYRTLPLADGEPDVGAMVGNIHAYFALLGRTPGPEDTADLVAIVLAGLPREVRALDLVRRFDEARERGGHAAV